MMLLKLKILSDELISYRYPIGEKKSSFRNILKNNNFDNLGILNKTVEFKICLESVSM